MNVASIFTRSGIIGRRINHSKTFTNKESKQIERENEVNQTITIVNWRESECTYDSIIRQCRVD